MNWLWQTFGLATPFTGEKYKDKIIFSTLECKNLHAISLSNVLDIKDNTQYPTRAFQHLSKETQDNIYREYACNDIDKIVESEMKNKTAYPVWFLLSGFIYGDNWKLLSSQDMKRWIESYGITSQDGFDKIKKIQNELLQAYPGEIYIHQEEMKAIHIQ